MRRKEVFNAIKPWGIKPKKVKRVRSVFKVWTKVGIYAFKSTKDSIERINFFDSVLKYVQNRGFEHLAPYVHTLNKEPYSNYNKTNMVLTPWIEGKEIRYRSSAETCAAAKVLAYFHQAAEGYQPEEGIIPRDKQGQWVEKIARRYGDIEFYKELAEKGQTEFDKLFLQYSHWILSNTKKSFEEIRESDYYRKVEISRDLVQICHGDPASRNFVVNGDGQVYMIDFDSVKYDLPVVDVWRFLRRILSRDQWNLNLAKKILSSYSEERKLDQTDYRLLVIFLTFPEKIWRILKKYYSNPRRDERFNRRYLHKLKRLLMQSEARERFLCEFSREFIGGKD